MINKKDVSVVICSNRKEIHTLDSIPDEMQIIIEQYATPLGRSRNEGIKDADRKWILLVDDDIKFYKTFLDFLCEIADENRIIGLEAYYPSPFVIGRLMMFSKRAWLDIGRFDNRAHGDETDWCYRAIKKGYKIIKLSRDCVYHYPHKKIKPKSELGTLFYLLRKHPDFLVYVMKVILRKMRYSSDDEEYI